MTKWYTQLSPTHIAMIKRQHIYFVASSSPNTNDYANVSPKGYASTLHVVTPSLIAYLDVTNSGIETIARTQAMSLSSNIESQEGKKEIMELSVNGGGKVTMMLCEFEDVTPCILRIFGRAYFHELIQSSTPIPNNLDTDCPTLNKLPHVIQEWIDVPDIYRAIIFIEIEKVSRACGQGVPIFTFEHDRDDLKTWAMRMVEKKGMETYKRRYNTVSESGLPGLPSLQNKQNEVVKNEELEGWEEVIKDGEVFELWLVRQYHRIALAYPVTTVLLVVVAAWLIHLQFKC